MSIKRYFCAVWGQVVATLTRFFRDKVALFFTFLFPLVFLMIFGTIFNNNDLHFRIGLVNQSETEFAKQFVTKMKAPENKMLKITDLKSFDEGREQIKRGQIMTIVELPKEFGTIKSPRENGKIILQMLGIGEHPSAEQLPSGTLKVVYPKASEQGGAMLAAMFDKILGEINHQMGHPEAPLKVKTEQLDAAGLTNFDYTFTGLVAFSILSMAVFGLSNALPTDKQKGVMRRLRASPLTKGQLLLGTGISYVITTLISVAVMVIVGLITFKFQMRGNWLILTGFVALSTVTLVGLGLMVGGWAQNERQSMPMANMIAMPLMFLSGIFFPVFLFPEWLQAISKFIPVTPIVDGVRMIMTEGAGLVDLAPQLAILGAWTAMLYVLATKLFRWE